MSRWVNKRIASLLGLLAGLLMATGMANAATVSVDTGTGKGTISKTWNVAVADTGGGQAVFTGDDIQYLAKTGQPRVPWGAVTVLLPPDANTATIKCDIDGAVYAPVAGTWDVAPQPLRATRDKDGKEIILWPEGVKLVNGRDTAIYATDASWPTDPVRLLSVEKMRKYLLAEVGVPLVTFDPATGALSLLSRADRALVLRPTDAAPEQSAAATFSDPIGFSRAKQAAVNFGLDAGGYGETASGPIDRGGGAQKTLSSTGYYILTTAAIQNHPPSWPRSWPTSSREDTTRWWYRVHLGRRDRRHRGQQHPGVAPSQLHGPGHQVRPAHRRPEADQCRAHETMLDGATGGLTTLLLGPLGQLGPQRERRLRRRRGHRPRRDRPLLGSDRRPHSVL